MQKDHTANWKRLQSEVDLYFKEKSLIRQGGVTLKILASVSALVFFLGVFSFYYLNYNLLQTLIAGTLIGLLGGYLGALGHEAVHYAFSSSKVANKCWRAVLRAPSSIAHIDRLKRMSRCSALSSS